MTEAAAPSWAEIMRSPVRVAGPVWVELLTRKVTVQEAMALGQLQVEGDPDLVTRLIDCYPRYGRAPYEGAVQEPA